MNTSEDHIRKGDNSNSKGKLFVVGIGPGGKLDRTHRAEQAIRDSSLVVGYKLYLSMISDLTSGKEIISSGMMQEIDRCSAAIVRASQGEVVSLVSSGDSGIYGMAGLAIELAHAKDIKVQIEIVPGVSSAQAAAARLGAPLMLDYATISLSDLLLDWETIKNRVKAVAQADLTIAIYNPRSKARDKYIEEVAEIVRSYRPGSTPVGIAKGISRDGESIILTDLDHFLEQDIDMQSVVIIGNSSSKNLNGWFVTPRGYKL